MKVRTLAAVLAVAASTLSVPQAFAGGTVIDSDVRGPGHRVEIDSDARGSYVEDRVSGHYNHQRIEQNGDHSITRINQFGVKTIFNGRFDGDGDHKDVWVGCSRDGRLHVFDRDDRPIKVLDCN